MTVVYNYRKQELFGVFPDASKARGSGDVNDKGQVKKGYYV